MIGLLTRATGALIFPIAALVIRIRNRSRHARSLDETYKRCLRPHFGFLVDDAVVTYRAKLWRPVTVFGYRIGIESSAQTFGNRIYVKADYRPDEFGQLSLIAHELTHVRQYQRAGSLARFGARYFDGYRKAGYSYAANSMESEAFALQRELADDLLHCFLQE